MLTEEEAKQKWCPMVRIHVVPDVGVYHNKPATDARDMGEASRDSSFCIGSACMMWRGKESSQFRHRADQEHMQRGKRLKPTPADIEGYCGLAGKP